MDVPGSAGMRVTRSFQNGPSITWLAKIDGSDIRVLTLTLSRVAVSQPGVMEYQRFSPCDKINVALRNKTTEGDSIQTPTFGGRALKLHRLHGRNEGGRRAPPTGSDEDT